MRETILSKLEASRKELLDLGLRNSLLNYKLPAGRGLHMVGEKSSAVFDILVRQGKAMSFSGKSLKEGSETEFEFAEPTDSELLESYSDTKLQTNESETALLKRLLNTYYSARTSIEEQGVNILYISLGMLNWYESESSQEMRQAPLVLIPVWLERSSARERFRIKYTLEEIGENISLQAKMKLEFNLAIRAIQDIEDFNIDEYFADVRNAISKLPRWKVEENTIELGFFSFGKFMIYNDLDNTKWPQERKLIENNLLQSLFENGFNDGLPSVDDDAFIDTETNAHELFQIVDADSSQLLTMLAVREGKNLVIQGPPGTGKSQTITNLIADAIGQNKKVLFVAEKMAALEVVKRRLDNNGLGEACLELHSHKANKKEMHQELMRVLELGRPNLQKLQQEVALLDSYKNELNAYCQAVNTEILQSDLTAHKVIGKFLQLREITRNIQLPKFQIDDFSQWDAERMKRAEAFCDRIEARLKVIGVPQQLLFWGSKLTVLIPSEQENLVASLKRCIQAIEELKKLSADIAGLTACSAPGDRAESQLLAELCNLAAAQPGLKEINIHNDAWVLNEADIAELLQMGERLSKLRTQYANIFIPEAFEQNVLEIRQNLIAHGHKWYKFIVGAYNKSTKQLAALCRQPLPKQVAARIQYVDDLMEIKRLTESLAKHENFAKELFGRRWQGLSSDWAALSQASKYLNTVHRD